MEKTDDKVLRKMRLVGEGSGLLGFAKVHHWITQATAIKIQDKQAAFSRTVRNLWSLRKDITSILRWSMRKQRCPKKKNSRKKTSLLLLNEKPARRFVPQSHVGGWEKVSEQNATVRCPS